jgi:diguanylate cyclase (GGDEF)-like protein
MNRAQQLLRRVVGLRFGSLRVRIAVVYAALFTVVLTLIVVMTTGGLLRFAETSAARDLAANARVFDEILDVRADQISTQADVLARDFGFREAVATGDVPTISSALASLEKRAASESAFVLTLEGEVLRPGNTGIPDPVSLWSSLDDGRTRGIIQTDNGLALAAATPIEAPDLIGWLVVAQPLDRAELDRLVGLAPIALEARVIDTRNQSQWLRAAITGTVFEREEQERALYYTANLAVLQEGITPRLVLRHALAPTLAEFSRINWLVSLLALAGIILVFGLSWRVARSVTEPLQQLDEATRRIGEGREVKLAIGTDDEIGRLATSFVNMAEAIEERERQIYIGLHDSLTGLASRKLFVGKLGQALTWIRPDDKLMLAFIDLDNFKVVNDTLGHPAGDALLKAVADQMRADYPDALIARFGGDEFAIMMDQIKPDTNLAGIAERLKQCLIASIPIEGQKADCSASIGIAVAPADGTDVSQLMKHADLALYRAKHEGKATYHFFEPELDAQARSRRQMEHEMRRAVERGEFELAYHPLYSVQQQAITGFEALIRWNHPERGLVPPDEFIGLAEETGLIIPIGNWVIREACHQASQWPDDITISVNITPKQFNYSGLPHTIMQALTNSGLAAHRFEIEVTENIFVADTEKVMATLRNLHNLGLRISLDDFGTGYSTLHYLRSFPFDKVKIDRTFVEDLGTSSNGHAVIRAITTLADALGMETLAEGVEDAAQYDVLAREGCRHIQGYLFSKPVAASAIAGLLADGAAYQRQLRA